MSGKRTGSLGVATTKGDLYTLDVNLELVRLGVGLDGQALVASAAAPGGMAWAYPITSKLDPPQYANAFGARRVANVANAGATQISVYVPIDFSSLVSLSLRFLPNANIVNKTVTIQTNASIPGEANTTHPTGPTGFLYTANGGIDTEVDITSMVPSIAANQWIGVGVTNTDGGTTISVVGTVMVYRRKLIP